MKNRRHGLKLLIEAGATRLTACPKEHWEGIKHFIASEEKQEEAAKNCAMKALVNTPNHFGCGGKVGAVGRLVSPWLHYSLDIFDMFVSISYAFGPCCFLPIIQVLEQFFMGLYW